MDCVPEKIGNNSFFNTLFSSEEQEKIKNAYANFKQYSQRYILKELENEFQSKFDIISDDFNRMYFSGKDHYKFEIFFDPHGISCAISRAKKSVILSQQSTGFKWYFNFYFQLNNGVKLEPGDIIIMDEPATNLHPYGQVELRSHIKSFAKKHDLTFVLATHSPFLIDIDNYDELRLVSVKDNVAHVSNLFSTVHHEDSDTLKPIKESLTIRQHILYDYDDAVVFVEGITDYNYLTMFKKLFKKDKIAFLPINGVGKGKEAQTEIIKKLIQIKHPNAILLVDNDRPGKDMKELSQNEGLTVHTIAEVNSKFKEIESLFSDDDRKKYAVDEKNSHYSSLVKNSASLNDFSKETINNFEELFKFLEEQEERWSN